MAAAPKPRVKSEDAKARLIEATIQLLQESSVFEISTRAIGERADLDRRAITRQFGGETELFIATLEELALRTIRGAEALPEHTSDYRIPEWIIRTNLWAFLILSGVDPERLKAIQAIPKGEALALQIIGLTEDAPRVIQEAFLTLLQAISVSGTFFGPSSPRDTPQNRQVIYLMLRYLASLGTDLPQLIGLENVPPQTPQ